MARELKIMKNAKNPLDDLKNAEITEKREKWEMHNVGPEIWRENWKSQKMRYTHFRTWNMAKKTEKCGIFRNVHCRTWNIARKQKIMENESKQWVFIKIHYQIMENGKILLYKSISHFPWFSLFLPYSTSYSGHF